MIKIKINNKEYEIEYYDLLKFCKELTLELTNEETNRINFKEYQKKYTYFSPYFDYIFGEQKNTVINPFYLENPKFECKDNKYIITEPNNLSHIFTYSTDDFIGLNETNKIETGFFILEDGTIIDNRYVERHLINATTLLNNYLIQDKYLCKSFFRLKHDKYYMFKIIDFLIKEKGVIYGRKDGNRILDLTINQLDITEEQLNTINLLSKKYKINLCNFEVLNKYNKKHIKNRIYND